MPHKELITAHLASATDSINCATTSCQALINAPLPELYQKALVAACTDISHIALLAGNLLFQAGYYCEQAVIEDNQTPAQFFRSIHNFIRHKDPQTQFFGGLIQTNIIVPTITGELFTHAIAVIALHDNHKATIVDTSRNPRIRKVRLTALNRRIWPENKFLQYDDGPLIAFTRAIALIGEPIAGRLSQAPIHQQRRRYLLEALGQELDTTAQTFIAKSLHP